MTAKIARIAERALYIYAAVCAIPILLFGLVMIAMWFWQIAFG